MPRRIWILLLGAGLLSPVAKAEESRVTVQLNGIGAMTCAHWRSTATTRGEGIVWIFGFWSGLNYVAAASEQDHTNLNAKTGTAEVARICAPDPSQILAIATWSAYVNSN